MLTIEIQQLHNRMKAIENYLQLHTHWEESTNLDQLSAPELADRSFRHCSTITNLYSLWEGFVEDALSSWLLLLPRYFKFDQLPESLRNKYCHAIADLLNSISKREFRHLSLNSIIQTYHNALQGNTNWGFVVDALTMHESNIRKAQLVQLFSSFDFHDVWHSIEKDAEVIAQKEIIDGSVNAENLLNDFVNYRNDASHGTPDNLLGPELLREWIYFIRAMCNALNRALTLKALHYEKQFFPDSIYGEVTENLRNNIIILRLDPGKKIQIGNLFYFHRPNSYKAAKVLSIQINNAPVNEFVNPSSHEDVGLCLSDKVQKNAKMLRHTFV